MRYAAPAIILSFLIVFLLTACAGRALLNNPAVRSSPVVEQLLSQPQNGWPAALPADVRQPWETLDAAGFVIKPSRPGRDASGINTASEFTPGVERFAEAGDVSDLGEASRLASGGSRGGNVTFAQYRFVLSGQQPGTVSADVNLKSRGDGSLSEYWLGLSDYGAGRWEWHGPFNAAQVRIGVADGNYLSGLGNLFITVVACSDSAFDIVGIGVSPASSGDTEPPPAPSGLTATPVAGGLELQWNAVLAGDLAGYRVYHRPAWFLDQLATGVSRVGYLEGGTRHLLLGLTAETFVRISAVDLNGNESSLSAIIQAMPLAGEPPQLRITTDHVSGTLGLIATLTATGAESYDWDLDGDGSFDVTGDSTGTAQVDTSRSGIIRPAVRGSSGGGAAVALGAVSLIVSGNARPVANGYANPSYGPAPLTVDFTGAGSDPDGEIVMYSWDFDGNGTYDWSDPANSNPPDQVYGVPYLRNVKFRVDDDQGAYDVDTVPVHILGPLPGPNDAPVANLTANKTTSYWPFTIGFDGSGSIDRDGTIAMFEWDYNGDGNFDAYGANSFATYTFPLYGVYYSRLRVTDNDGAQDEDELLLTLPSEWWMFGMEPTHRRQSPYIGAQTKNVKWSYATASEIQSSAAIGADGTIYFGSGDFKLYALRPGGSLKWAFPTGDNIRSSPAIGADGTIYFGSDDANVYALNPDGSLKWQYTTGSYVRSSPAIGPNGTVYIGSHDGNLYAFNPDGTVKWSYLTGGELRSAPALAPDGTVYVGALSNVLFAIGPDGSFKWSFTTGDDVFSSPAVGPDGTIYFGSYDNNLYAMNPFGGFKWSFTAADSIFSSPAIAADGTIYVGSLDGNLYAINPNGSLKWPYATGGAIHGCPAIGADGTIYIGSYDAKIYAITPAGGTLWTYAAGDWVRSAPAIGADGTVYVGSYDYKLYAFGAP